MTPRSDKAPAKKAATKPLLAWHGDAELKNATVATMAAHRKADRLVKGLYWENGRGCAVGCLIHGSDHALYEPRFGIPQALARLEDTIFEGLLSDRYVIVCSSSIAVTPTCFSRANGFASIFIRV